MRIILRRDTGDVCARLNVERKVCMDSGFAWDAVLTRRQLTKIEKACGGQSSRWVLHAGEDTCRGTAGELAMKLVNLMPEVWALCWGKE